MNGTFKLVAPLVAALTIAACNGGSSNVPASPGQSTAQTGSHSVMPEWQAKGLARPACPQLTGKPACMVLIVNGIRPDTCIGSSCGIAPAELQARYKLPITKGSGQIVAIVDAGDNPDVATSLSTYRSEFGLGTANFKKYNQTVNKATTRPRVWLSGRDRSRRRDGLGKLPEVYDLSRRGKQRLFERPIRGCDGSADARREDHQQQLQLPDVERQLRAHRLRYAGHVVSGLVGRQWLSDNFGPPSIFPTVVAVGGTQITGGGTGEMVWNGAGAGCISGQTKPSWQHDPSCTGRTDSDISAQAGVSPGVAEYD